MYAVCAAVSWMAWESSMRSRSSSLSRSADSCRLIRSNRAMRLTDATTAYMAITLASRAFS